MNSQRLWLRGAIVFSFALNLFLLGGVIYHGFIAHSHRPGIEHSDLPRIEAMLRRMSQDLPAADITIFNAIIQQHHLEYDDLSDRFQSVHNQLNKLLRENPLDRLAIEGAMNELYTIRGEEDAALKTSLLEAIFAISPEARAQLAANRLHSPHPPPDHSSDARNLPRPPQQ